MIKYNHNERRKGQQKKMITTKEQADEILEGWNEKFSAISRAREELENSIRDTIRAIKDAKVEGDGREWTANKTDLDIAIEFLDVLNGQILWQIITPNIRKSETYLAVAYSKILRRFEN